MFYKWLNKKNKTLDSLASIATILAVFGAILIGAWQNQINHKLEDIASRELISSKSPLLSVDFASFKYDKASEFFTKEVLFSNKGIVPINGIRYEISFPGNPQNVPPPKQVLDGTLFQEESVVRKTVMNKVTLNEPVQIVVIKVNFFSYFDQKKEYCVKRSYTFQTKNELLEPLGLPELYNCN
jgi:hypothetical protein